MAGLPGSASARRALWVWDGPTMDAVDVAIADGYDALFVHTAPGFDPADYAGFIDSAHAAGIDVYAMGGDPAWAQDRRAWKNWVGEVVDAGVFDGAVADVEPYLLPGWDNDRTRRRIINNYVSRLEAAHDASGSMDLIATIPFWWDLPEFDKKGESLAERVVARSDGIVVMAYRDSASGPDGIVAHAANEVAAAAGAGRLAWVGIETAPASLDKVTFWEEGRSAVATELAIVDQSFGAGYAGAAIHHYGSWVSLGG